MENNCDNKNCVAKIEDLTGEIIRLKEERDMASSCHEYRKDFTFKILKVLSK